MLSQPIPFTFPSNSYAANTAQIFQAAYLYKAKLLSDLQTTLGKVPVVTNKTEQRKPIHILQKNVECLAKRPYEEDLDSENFEFIHKKVKSVEVVSSPSTQADDLKSPHKQDSISDMNDLGLEQIKSPIKSRTFLSKKEKITKTEKQGEKPTQVKEVVFDHKANQLKFKVEFNKGSINQQVKSLTREEILKEDPALLLAFYESHLRFAKATEFNPMKLKTL